MGVCHQYEDHLGSAGMCLLSHTHTHTHTHLAHTLLLHTRLTSYTLHYTLSYLSSQALVLALMGFLPPSSTYSSLLYMYQWPQHPPSCPFSGATRVP